MFFKHAMRPPEPQAGQFGLAAPSMMRRRPLKPPMHTTRPMPGNPNAMLAQMLMRGRG